MALFNVLFLSCRWGSKERVAKTQGSKSRLVCIIAKVFEMILTLFKLRTFVILSWLLIPENVTLRNPV